LLDQAPYTLYTIAPFISRLAAGDMDRRQFLMDFTMGGVSGAIAKTLLAPIYRIKSTMQFQRIDQRIQKGEEPRYKGIVDCAIRIYEKQGIMGLWTGNIMDCLRYFPTQAMNLAFKDTFKKMFPKFNPKTEFTKFFLANLVSGGAAAVSSLFVVYPMDSVNTALVADQSGRFRGPMDVVKKTLSKSPLWFYTGFGISTVGIVLYRGLQLSLFDKLTGLNPWKQDKSLLGFWSKFVASQLAITVGAFLTYPMDTVRRRLQMDYMLAISDETTEYEGVVDCIKKIARGEGLAGFYEWFPLNTLASISGTIAIMTYGYGRKHLGL